VSIDRSKAERLRARLEEELADAVRRHADLEAEHARFVAASRDSNADDEHDPEGATIAFERAQVETLLRQVEVRRAQVAEALERLARGEYGVCRRCRRPIDVERLLVRPSATTCVRC